MGERERRVSLDFSPRRLSREVERCRRLCLSLERSRLRSFSPLSRERSRRLSLEPSLFLSPDLSRLLSRDLSRRLSFDPFLLRSLSRDPWRLLSLDDSRGFLYGSGDGSRLRSTPASTDTSFGLRSLETSLGLRSRETSRDLRSPETFRGLRSPELSLGFRSRETRLVLRSLDASLGFRSLEPLLDRRAGAIDGAWLARSGAFLLSFVCGVADLPSTICCVSRRRALYGDSSLAILGSRSE
jgi:hypothetical protein